MTEKQFSKLPKHVRDEISLLRHKIKFLNNALDLALRVRVDSRVVVEPHSEERRYLDEDTIIRFNLGDHWSEYIDVQAYTEHTGVRSVMFRSGTTQMVFAPASGNLAYALLRRG